MSAEFWAISAVGASGLAIGIAILALDWRAFDSLRGDMATVKERLARIEGWIAGRFREETTPSHSPHRTELNPPHADRPRRKFRGA